MKVAGYDLLSALAGRDIYEARDSSGKACVVSLLPALPGGQRDTLIRRLAQLRAWQHPHVVQVRDVQELADGRLLVAHEALSGTTLGTIAAARGELSGPEIAHVWDGIGSALGALHERGIIHGDVSADNIMVTDEGRPVLIDVCATPALEGGTDGFQAPERLAGGPASAAADVYSFAAVLRSLSASTALADLLADCADADPAARPSCRDLVARRCQFAHPEPVSTPSDTALAAARIRRRLPATEMKPRRRTRSRRPPRRAVAVSFAIAAVLGAGALTGRAIAIQPPSPQASIAEVTLTVAEQTPTPAEHLTRLLHRRDAALMAGDVAALSEVYTPDAPALLQDRDTLARWAAEDTSVAGLTTTVLSTSAHGERIQAVISVGPHERTYAGETATVAATAPTCFVFFLNQDRIAAIAACETGPQEKPAGP
ncbi:hypothetical protein BSZ39_05220 [Bowdeniella nasicola]|uniref:non-specific serine/threonine protein kinase n=1 Tax=Bowdeniella nasicola TaxID=208480 RepID=A0A1Q5Q346_9ACTO|nr:protein kinase [Bowdeniella nasicola]OKL54236.1 hypothetical protein BSZ39_05220 [Bowdeniella nasicola]